MAFACGNVDEPLLLEVLVDERGRSVLSKRLVWRDEEGDELFPGLVLGRLALDLLHELALHRNVECPLHKLDSLEGHPARNAKLLVFLSCHGIG